MKELIGKNVRIIISMGDTTMPLDGKIKDVNDWITLEVRGKIRIVNKSAVVYVEEK
jgi:RNase P/RNase MRP subunit p29